MVSSAKHRPVEVSSGPVLDSSAATTGLFRLPGEECWVSVEVGRTLGSAPNPGAGRPSRKSPGQCVQLLVEEQLRVLLQHVLPTSKLLFRELGRPARPVQQRFHRKYPASRPDKSFDLHLN